MSPELEAELVRLFPEMYLDMPWGFQCGNGWYQLLFALSSNISKLAQDAGVPQPKVAQVKNKFGELRFYLEVCDQTIREVVVTEKQRAREISMVTCEKCGQPGVITSVSGYISPRCEKHRDIR